MAGTCNRFVITRQKTVVVDRMSVLPLHLFTRLMQGLLGVMADVRYTAHFGLMSDIAPLLRWANSGSQLIVCLCLTLRLVSA